jgi:hypothetical protein
VNLDTPHRIEVTMSITHDTAAPDTGAPHRVRRFRLIRGGARGQDRIVAEPPPKQVLLSPRSARWLPSLGEALGPSYRVVLETHDTPAAVVIDSREDDLEQLVQQQRATTRIIVVHTGHPSEQPMTPAALLDLGADTYLAPAALPALAAHLKALTRSWGAFPPRPEPGARAG